MNRLTFKNYLIRDKGFLRDLFEGQSKIRNNQILNVACDTKLNTLIKLLHFIANGEIKIKREHFEDIREHRKLNILKRNVEKKSALNRLLQSERIDKLKFLKQFSAIYSSILYTLFHET